MNGAYFKGWGFMRFWEPKNERRHYSKLNGESKGFSGSGAIDSNSWKEPYRSTLASFNTQTR